MAERRMFAKTIIDSDAFLDMPISTQALYFHLGMRADDDGFLNNAKKIQRTIGCSDDDLKILFSKNFIISMGDGICVIKHWKVHNLIQKDRYKPTNYLELKDKLSIKNNNVYTMDTECIQDVSSLEPQVRLGEVRQGEDRLGKSSKETMPRATRLSTEITLSSEWMDEAIVIRPEWDSNKVKSVFDNFKDYWIAKSGKEATKLDWLATWRNWCRNERSFNPKANKQSIADQNKSAIKSAKERLFGSKNEEKEIDGERI